MPGLVVFGRRWGIADDDLVFPSVAEVIVRAAWLIAVIIIYELHHESMASCEHGHLLQIFLVGMIVLVLFVIILNSAIFLISIRGTIMNNEPRRRMPAFVVARALMNIPEVGWNVLGTYWLFGSKLNCSEDVISTVRATVICSWILLTVMVCSIAIIFDPLGNEMYNLPSQGGILPHLSRQSAEVLDRGEVNSWSHRVWEFRCRLLCCCAANVNQEVYSNLAKNLSILFQDVDLVPSDVAAGLVLLHQQEKANVTWEPILLTGAQNQEESSPSEYSADANGLSEAKPSAWKFWMTPEMANHYMRFAFACYGWPFYMVSHCGKGLCHLYTHLRCCGCIRTKPHYVVDDNCCQCNTAVLKQMTGLSDEDLIYVSYHNRVFEVPFFIAVDHQTCSVVVAVRGTLSLTDALTDLTIECVPLDIPDLPPYLAAHKGMLAGARYVHKRLVETNALNDALALHQRYSLVITGHSLGAGIGAILAILLKPCFPNVRCFSFSPPACLLSRETAYFSEDFVLSVVLGNDLVCRLSYSTVDELKRRLIRSLHNCHSPKYRVLINQCFDCCFGLGTQYEWSTASTPGQAFPLLQENAANQNARYESLTSIVQSGPSLSIPCMYLPGLILHVESLTISQDVQEQPTFSSKWVPPEKFNRIIVTPQMLSDHTPHSVGFALEYLVRQGPQFFTGVEE